MTDSIGARLRQARELRRLTLQQASETTRVRAHYLQALESDDYTAIPSAAQARGFLRIYAEFLELDIADLVPPAPPREPEPAAPASAPVSGGAASGAHRPNLWASLRGRLGRRATKESSMAPGPQSPPVAETPTEMQAAGAQAVEAGPAPASTDVKTKTSARKGSLASPPSSGTQDTRKKAGS